MNSERPSRVIARDLVDEAKKRIVFLIVSVVGLSYLMSCECSFIFIFIFLICLKIKFVPLLIVSILKF